jgi:transposase
VREWVNSWRYFWSKFTPLLINLQYMTILVPVSWTGRSDKRDTLEKGKQGGKRCQKLENITATSLQARVALEAIKGYKSANEIAAEYGVHPTQIAQWKKQALDGLPELFSMRRSEQTNSEEALIASLYQQIGQLIRAGRLAGKKIKSTALRSNERSLSRSTRT